MKIPLTSICAFAIFSSAFATGCSAAQEAVPNDSPADEAVQDGSSEEAIAKGSCVIAPKSRELLGNPLTSGAVPPFSSVTWSADSTAKVAGAWGRESSAFISGVHDPNRWTSPGQWAINAPVRGAYIEWSLSLPKRSTGLEYSIYAYIPGAAQATKALYRVYDGQSSSAVGTLEVNQQQAKAQGAAITLNGKRYSFQGWVFLGKHRLNQNARVSLDASASQGKLVADSVVAVRWGCL